MSNHQFDSAALAGTLLAGALVIFAEPGPFDWMNGIVGMTIFSILIAYEKGRTRNPGKNFALSTVIALTLLRIVGLVFEVLHGPALTRDGFASHRVKLAACVRSVSRGPPPSRCLSI